MTGAAATRAKVSRRRMSAVALLTILAAAAGLRLFSIADEAVWYDEVISIEHLADAASLPDYLARVHPRSPAPPFYFVTQYAWAQAAGPSVLAARLLSVLYSVAGLAMLFVLTRRLLTPKVALIATAWTALLIWHVYHAQGIRFYALTHLFTLITIYTFVRLVEQPASRSWLTAETAASALMVWTHPHTALLFAVLGVYLLAYRRANPSLIAAWMLLHGFVAASLIAYLAVIDREAAYALTGWIDKPGLFGPDPSAETFAEAISGLMPLAPTNPAGEALLPLRPVFWSALILLTAGGAFGGAVAIRRNTRGIAGDHAAPIAAREKTAFLLLWLLLPPAMAFLLSYVWQPVFLGRYLLYAAFPAYILLGAFLATRSRRWVIAAFFAVLITYDALFYYPGPIRTPFDDVAAVIVRDPAPVEAVYVDNMLLAEPLAYYWNEDGPEIVSTIELEALEERLMAGEGPGASSRWLVFSLPHRFRYWQRRLPELGVPHRVHDFPAGRPVYVIEIPPASGPR